MKHCKGLTHYKNKVQKEKVDDDEDEEAPDTFNRESSISMNVAIQPKNFLNEFLENSIPPICTVQINNFQMLTYSQVTQLFTKVLPRGLKQLILVNNFSNKISLSPQNMRELLDVIENKLTDAITLQAFKITDLEFSNILACSKHLELICIKNCLVVPHSGKLSDELVIDVIPIQTSSKP